MSRLQTWQRDMADAGSDAAERLRVLKRWAQVKVAHRLPVSLPKRREGFHAKRGESRARFGRCLCCRKVAQLDRHHVIQLQNGGHNGHMNVVDICRACHAAIHPWMRRKAN